MYNKRIQVAGNLVKSIHLNQMPYEELSQLSPLQTYVFPLMKEIQILQAFQQYQPVMMISWLKSITVFR